MKKKNTKVLLIVFLHSISTSSNYDLIRETKATKAFWMLHSSVCAPVYSVKLAGHNLTRVNAFLFFSQLLCYSVESCVQMRVQAQVPVILEPGDVVSHGTVFSNHFSFTSHYGLWPYITDNIFFHSVNASFRLSFKTF